MKKNLNDSVRSLWISKIQITFAPKIIKNMDHRKRFQQTQKLYHFTRFDTALKIIESNCLKFGKLSNMNDLHENDKVTFVDISGKHIEDLPSDVLDALHDEIYRYRQISLTAEGEYGDELGFNLHQMWGHYADKGDGVCLVFDKNELMKSHDMPDITHDRVNYDKPKELVSFAVSKSEKPEEVVNEVSSKTKEIFFHKRKEWEHEQEYRLIKRCPLATREEYFRLGHALKYVILSSKLQNNDEIGFAKRITEIKAKLDKVEEARNKGDEGKIPVLIYGNGLFDYSLITEDGNETIWTSRNGYDIFNLIRMRTEYTSEQLQAMTNEELMDKVKDCAVDFHYYDGRRTQLCVGDLQGLDEKSSVFTTRTGIKINLHEVKSIVVTKS